MIIEGGELLTYLNSKKASNRLKLIITWLAVAEEITSGLDNCMRDECPLKNIPFAKALLQPTESCQGQDAYHEANKDGHDMQYCKVCPWNSLHSIYA